MRGALFVLAMVIPLWATPSHAARPSPTRATGVINEAYGIDRSNWDAPAHIGIAVTRMDDLLPTTLIEKGPEACPLPRAPKMLDLKMVRVTDPGTGVEVGLDALLDGRIRNDGILVIHRGKVVHESYRGGFSPETRHANLSTSKSITGMLAGIAIDRNLLDTRDLASKYVPELAEKRAWADVTVRHVMDMRDGMRFDQDFANAHADIWMLAQAVGWYAGGPGGPRGVRDWLSRNLDVKQHPVAERFSYASVQADILGMILETAFGKTLDRILEEELWKKIGAEQDAGFAADGQGFHLADGGMSMTLRDFGRVALLVLRQGKNLRGEQVVPASFFEDLVTPEKFLRSAFEPFGGAVFPDGQYRSLFWVVSPEKRQVAMLGVYGQTAYVDYGADLAIVTFGAYPVMRDKLLLDSIQLTWSALTDTLTASP